MNVTRLSMTAMTAMTTLTTLTATTIASLGLLTVSAPQSLADMSQIPETIQVPAGQTLKLSLAAEGDQIYTCQVKPDRPNEFAWTLKAPEARLLDQQGELVGQHYSGPSWQMNDGSKIVGELNQKVDAPQTDDIPWLLLRVKSHEGEGVFSSIDWIQRVNTSGGKAPMEGCDRYHKNDEVRVGYAADYYFYGE